ncbi:primosomal replication protein N [Undibacterium sp. Ji50W]|uniref:primosomal replication protein N n=1 Tax=Undibacterium TaxID=401469 RepID=UPI003BF33525
MNQLKLVARIVEKTALRYTPAGIPIASATLMHSSETREANAVRQVEFEISAVAAGEISRQFNEIALDVPVEFTGFLARKNRNSKSLVFHVTEFGTPLLD